MFIIIFIFIIIVTISYTWPYVPHSPVLAEALQDLPEGLLVCFWP